MNIKQQAYNRLVDHGLRPSVQRLTIMEFLLKNRTHPTVEDVYQGVVKSVPTLSRTTVYNTLRMFADMHIAQMITVDDHRVCYDGDLHPHVHFFCRECEQVYARMDEEAPDLPHTINNSVTMLMRFSFIIKGFVKAVLQRENLRL